MRQVGHSGAVAVTQAREGQTAPAQTRLSVAPPPQRGLRVKRVFDVVVSALALVLLAPVLLLVSLAVLIAMGRPVLFRQQRPGLHREPFVILKFRTMNSKRDSAGRLLPDAERLTRFGRFLRHTSLDELPELLNVLKGDMSLVGPRPLLMRYLDRYSHEQNRRHDIRPGITGWTQVNGRNALDWDEKFALDLWYMDHRSLLFDVKILVLTVWKALKREGITRPGWATTEEFWGILGLPRERLGGTLVEDAVHD